MDGDRDPAFAAVGGVATAEDAVWDGVARTVADAAERFVVRAPGDEGLGETDDAALDLRQVDMLALARLLSMEQGRREQQRRVARRQRVRDRAVGPDGLPVRPAGQVVEARERRALAAEARIVPVRPRRAVQTRADHDEVGPLLRQRGVVEAPLLHRTWREVLRDGVGPERQPLRDGDAFRHRQVQRARQLVHVQHREVLGGVEPALEPGRELQRPQEVRARLRLDADDGRAAVREVAHRDRPGGTRAELEDGRAPEDVHQQTLA